MSIRDDKKDLNAAGPIPAERYAGAPADPVAEAEDPGAKKALTDEPGEDFRAASGGESNEEHDLTTDSPRWGAEGSSREERGYPREGGEERRVSDEPPERDIHGCTINLRKQ